MISRKLIKKIGFKQIGPSDKSDNHWKTEVWFNERDMWVHYDKPDPRLKLSFDATNNSLEEFIVWFNDRINKYHCRVD